MAIWTPQMLVYSAANLGFHHLVYTWQKNITNINLYLESFCCLGGEVRRNYPYAEGDAFLIRDFRCSVSARNISECSIQYFTDSYSCRHRTVAGVQCGRLSQLQLPTKTLVLNMLAWCRSYSCTGTFLRSDLHIWRNSPGRLLSTTSWKSRGVCEWYLGDHL